MLLAFSLGPLFLSRGITGRAATKMSGELAENTRVELLEIVTAELQYNAISLLNVMEGGGQAMTLAVDLLARQAVLALDEAPVSNGKPVYFSTDFYDLDIAPPDTFESSEYVKKTRGDKVHSLPVSFESPAFHLPPGVDGKKVEKQIRQLQSLTPVFQAVHDQLNSYGYTLQVGLESGVLLTYPGRGGFPMMYDHRGQQWYEQVKGSTRHQWDSPVVEPTTRQVVSTLAFPLRDAKGAFLGAASMDVPLTAMLHEAELKSRWSGDIRSYLVVPQLREDGSSGLRIVAQESYGENQRRHWMSGIEIEWMANDDPRSLELLMAAMDKSESGFLHLSLDGTPSVCAFASTDSMSVLLVAPEGVVSRLPDQVAGSMDSLFDQMRSISSIISGVMLIITGFIAWFGSRAITRPLLGMANAAKRLAGGDFSARIAWRSNDERDILVEAFNDMGPKLEEHLRISKDLELAKEVQRLLLPSTQPDLGGYDLSGGISYCDQTGGDYYDFIDVQGDKERVLGVVLGDVSGHGIPAALVMAAARGQLHSISQIPLEPHERIQTVNTLLSADLDGTGRFLTLFYLRLRENDDTVHWVRAGHDPAIWYSPQSGEFDELGGDGLALGVLGDFKFQSYSATLAAGDVLVLATDGVWEARNEDGEMFGKKRMLAIIKENAHNSAVEIRTAIMESVAAYEADGQEDDIAVVVIRKL